MIASANFRTLLVANDSSIFIELMIILAFNALVTQMHSKWMVRIDWFMIYLAVHTLVLCLVLHTLHLANESFGLTELMTWLALHTLVILIMANKDFIFTELMVYLVVHILVTPMHSKQKVSSWINWYIWLSIFYMTPLCSQRYRLHFAWQIIEINDKFSFLYCTDSQSKHCLNCNMFGCPYFTDSLWQRCLEWLTFGSPYV